MAGGGAVVFYLLVRDQDDVVAVAGGVAVANMELGPASGRLPTCNSRTP